MRLGLYFAVAGIVALMSASWATIAMAQSSDPMVEIVQKWLGSGHANARSPAFTHWDEEGEIPQNCATCHAGAGFRAFHGFGRGRPELEELPVRIGGVVDCATCHSGAIDALQAITFPSGIEVADIGSSASCMTCHQGRQSGIGVSSAVADMDEDTVNPELSFINPHYKIAAATLLGGEAKGGYEYEGKVYMGRFSHVKDFAQCTDCHDPHSLEVRVEECVSCHKTEDPMVVRMSAVDFDGDGDTSEGIAREIASLHTQLEGAMMAYAKQVAGTPLVYEGQQYPYVFIDTNENGIADADETVRANQFKSWTPRLLKAAYNFQFVAKDSAAFVHNPHYALQLLFDSIESLSQVADTGVTELNRP